MKTNTIYRPLTATPLKCDSTYKETEPCQTLQPYVQCFWCGEYDCAGTETYNPSEIIIPDTCVDIIYHIDDTGNITASEYIGICDTSFRTSIHKKYKVSVFAIRFYAWSAYVFSEDSFAGTVNGKYDVRERFHWLDRELRRQLPELRNPKDRIRLAEALLMKKLETARIHRLLDGAVSDILRHQGALEIGQLCRENFISSRQAERIFHEYIGITPKKLSNLVRYQCVWRDIVNQSRFSRFDILDAVHKYGYTDSPHLMREFGRYHSMNIRAAKAHAGLPG